MTTLTHSDVTQNVTEVAEDIYSLRLPMPYSLDHINVYVIKDNNRLALVDCGLDLPDSWAALEKGLTALGLRPQELTDIFVTHSHIDHMGQLDRLRGLAPEARLFMHQVEYEAVVQHSTDPKITTQVIQKWLDHNGMEGVSASEIAQIGFQAVPELRPGDNLLNGGERIRLEPTDSTNEWEILWTPGHTAGHLVLYNQDRNLLLSGDHLLSSISSNIGKYPGSSDDPLGDYIEGLEAIHELEIGLVLPAHGHTFTNYRDRIKHLIGHHQHRLGKIYSTLEHGPSTAAEVVQMVWGNRLEGFNRYLGLVEALSHLERLHREGRVTTEEDGQVIRYRAA
jgi:glyoxylase-like metal-dependent hydrolase (beta-lactamase superfamily II)